MNVGLEHTPDNVDNISIRLGVHPNIISKSIDQKVFKGL